MVGKAELQEYSRGRVYRMSWKSEFVEMFKC